MGGDTAWMPLRGSTVCTGENISLTMPFNPMYVNMDQFHGGPIHGPTRANPSIMVNYGILVKKDGTRFIDEVETYVYVAKAMPKLIPTNQAFIIIDNQVTGISTIDDRIKRYDVLMPSISKRTPSRSLQLRQVFLQKRLIRLSASTTLPLRRARETR